MSIYKAINQVIKQRDAMVMANIKERKLAD